MKSRISFQALLIPLEEAADSFIDFDFVRPAEPVELFYGDELSRGAVGFGGVEDDVSGEAYGLGDEL